MSLNPLADLIHTLTDLLSSLSLSNIYRAVLDAPFLYKSWWLGLFR